MQVETYEVISVDEQNGSVVNETVSEEAMALIESMNLEGQRGLLQEKTVGGETVTVRNPYRIMTMEERRVYEAVLPMKTPLRKYADGPIPLRVLQVAAHATDLFNEVTVWHPEPGKTDPLLVGTLKVNTRGWDEDQTHILARWGEILVPFAELREEAKKRIAAGVRARIAEARAKLATFEATYEASLDAHLNGGRVASEYIHLDFNV